MVSTKNIPDPRGMSHYTFWDGMKIPKIMTRFFLLLCCLLFKAFKMVTKAGSKECHLILDHLFAGEICQSDFPIGILYG